MKIVMSGGQRRRHHRQPRAIPREAACWAAAALMAAACLQPAEAEDYFRPQLVIDAKGLLGNAVVSVDVSNDGNWLAASSGKEVLIWDRSTGQHFVTLRGYQEPGGFRVGTVNRVRFLPDNRHLAVAVSDNTEFGSARLYDLSTPFSIEQLLKGHVGCTRELAVSPGGKYLVTTGCDGMLYVNNYSPDTATWNPSMQFHTGGNGPAPQQMLRFPLPHGAIEPASHSIFAFPWNDEWFLFTKKAKASLMALSSRAFVKYWPNELHALIEAPRLAMAPFPGEHVYGPYDAARDNNNVWTLRTGYSQEEEATTYWGAVWRNGELVALNREHRERPTAASLNLQAGLAVTGDAFGQVHVWPLNPDPDRPREVYETANRQFYRVAWSSDGRRLRFADRNYPQGEYIFNRLGPLALEFRLDDRGAPAELQPRPQEVAEPTPWLKLRERSKTGVERVCCQKKNEEDAHWQLVDNKTRPLQPQRMNGLATHRIAPAQLIDDHHFGNVWSYLEVPAEQRISGDPELWIGAESGALIQASISRHPDGDAPCLLVRRNFIGHSARVTSLDLSPDGKRLASGSWDGTLRIWDLGVHRRLPDVDFHADGTSVVNVPRGSQAEAAGLQAGDVILELAESSFFARHRRALDGELSSGAVSLRYRRGADERVTQLKLTPGVEFCEPSVSIFLSRDGQWIAWTPQGYYDSSPGGEQYIGWHVNRARFEPAQFYQVGQYRAELYRPDIISEALKPADASDDPVVPPPAPSRLQVADNFNDVEPPSVAILAPANNSTTAAAEVLLKIGVSYRVGKPKRFKELLLQVNGATPGLGPELTTQLVEGDVHHDVYEQRVALNVGDNTISVRATNRDKTTSAVRQITIRREVAAANRPLAQVDLPNLYILAIGVSKYSQEDWRLKFADKDARDFVAAFERQENKFYGKVASKILTDEAATVDGIKDGMQWLKDNPVREKDQAFIFLAGHGVFDDRNTWHFGAVDLDPNKLLRTGISEGELRDFMQDQLPCRVILFADTCHAAQAFEKQQRVRRTHSQGVEPWRNFDKLALLSCLPQQESQEGARWKNGVFTHCLVRALERPENDIDRDGFISFTELYSAVHKDVKAETQHQQEPSHVTNVATGAVLLGVLP